MLSRIQLKDMHESGPSTLSKEQPTKKTHHGLRINFTIFVFYVYDIVILTLFFYPSPCLIITDNQ